MTLIKFSLKKHFLKKNISKKEINKLKKLNIKNFEIETRHSRHYPLGEQIAPLIGFYGTDGAQEGLERSYDSILSGVPGKKKYFKNAKQEERKIIEEKKKTLIKIKNLQVTTKKESLNILKNYINNWYGDKNIISNKNLNSKFDKLIIEKYLEIGIDYRTADIDIYKTKIKIKTSW